MKSIDMHKRTRLLAIYLLAFATVAYGQTGGADRRRGGGQGSQRPPLTYDFNDHENWKQIFDGRTLNGWDGSKSVWRIEDGAIVGESTVEHPTIWWVNPANTGTAWLIFNEKVKNFELKAEMKLTTESTNSGIQFRATRLGAIPDAAYAAEAERRIPADGPKVRPNNTQWENRGYQGDFTYDGDAAGNLIECCMGPQRGVPPRREGTAGRGTAVRIAETEGRKPELLGTIGDPKDLLSHVKIGDWNQVEIIASGNVFMYTVNGYLMSVWIDDNPKMFSPEGELALQLEGGGNVKVMFRNLWLKTLP